ncbi:MAG: GNAT family N-acetyltransferase [Candidatus Bathyarchaeales archaeon]
MAIIKRACEKDIQVLSKKLLSLLEDKNSQIYQDNIAKFGIPEEYVKNAFAEKTLLKRATTGKATFYLALENSEIIGFAQTIQQNAKTIELDRIVIFPQHARKGIGTQLLREVVADQEQKGIDNIIVNAGKEESHARQFYEKNGFKQIKEVTIETPWGKELAIVTYQLCLRRS